MSENAQRDSDILCDMCTEDRKPARKTCMKCEISMCVQHLQAHLTTPVLLQTHPLTEPMALGENTKCPQHGKLLEYYCLDDMTLVCVSCAIEDQHRLHNMKTFSTAHKELMEKLKAEQQALQEKSDDEIMSLEKWEHSEREKLGRCSVRLIEAVTNLRDVSLTSIQSSVSARMVSIKTSKSSMQAAQKEKDIFRFLQMFSQVNQDVEKAKAVDLRKGLEPGSRRDKLAEEIRQTGEKMMKQTSGFIGSLLTLVDPENHQELTATGSDLIFEPQNLGPGISLSKDRRTVFYSDQTDQSSVHMFLIQSMLSCPDFNRWVIRLSKDSDWSVGMCDKNDATDMKDWIAYGLRCQGNQLFSLTERGIRPLEQSEASTCSQPPTVEVVLVFPDTLSFVIRIGQFQRVKVLTLKMMSTNWDRVPFVCMERHKPKNLKGESVSSGFGKSSFTLGQSPGGGLFGYPANSQKQWKCSCGKVYSETTDGYYYEGSIYKKSSQVTCSCGRVVGSPPITEVLCELL